ncbi:MAG TPA: penicillin-binding transpeptidase domain-containing protein [Pirellulales bacterium]|nr:penicillin-binding transpeptidase domain-containing protein [Pirellulales bacterium]
MSPRYPRTDRLRWLLAAMVVFSVAVLLRVLTLEIWYGDEYREIASRPIERVMPLAAARGRILARDGTVLACDREVAALAVHYRYLEQPPNRAWLHRLARGRLPRSQRRATDLVEAECGRIVQEQAELYERLAELCGLDSAALRSQLAKTQARVERIAQSVRARREERPAERPGGADARGWRRVFAQVSEAWFTEGSSSSLSSANLTVAEEYEYHPIHVGLSLESVADIEGHPDRYPGVRIVTWRQRVYPQGSLAAHAIGYVPDAPAELLGGAELPGTGAQGPKGQQGVERYYDELLRGSAGQVREATDRSGRLVWRHVEREPTPGGDLTLSIDPALARTAEQLLDHALRRRLVRGGEAPSGGAIVVMDIQSGALVCSASSPRFAPDTMARGNAAQIGRLLTDPAKPLFDRACRMALPPGSVFKPLTAIALVEEGIVDPSKSFYCQGYLHSPDRQRCQIFRQSQTGHGRITLAEALSRSCNVYFFHYAQEAAPERLIHWAERFGFGAATGINLPDESAGGITNQETQALRPADISALAIGQGTLTATPLQVARLMAAIASGGRLITPRIALGDGPPDSTIVSLSEMALGSVRRGLEQVVADSHGTANATVRLDSISIAGKTGTAETALGQDHAWFAGYVPADDPKVALAVVIEHAGSGGESAGPVARRLVEKMESLGYFARRNLAQRKSSPGPP